jgi:transposase, IS5 family
MQPVCAAKRFNTRTFIGNPYDAHTMSQALSQVALMIGDIPTSVKTVIADLDYRGVDRDNPEVEIIHRGKMKELNDEKKGWLKRRQAVEPEIGHLKSDHRMDRCWLKGAVGDALHTIDCAAGYNLRWLFRAIARMGLLPIFLRFILARITLQKRIETAHMTPN